MPIKRVLMKDAMSEKLREMQDLMIRDSPIRIVQAKDHMEIFQFERGVERLVFTTPTEFIIEVS